MAGYKAWSTVIRPLCGKCESMTERYSYGYKSGGFPEALNRSELLCILQRLSGVDTHLAKVRRKGQRFE